jgi:hypothetical protein
MTQPIVDALRKRFKSPEAVLSALGLDEALLRGGGTEKRSAVAEALKAAIKTKTGIAQDAELSDLLEMLDALKATQESALKEIGAVEAEAQEEVGEEEVGEKAASLFGGEGGGEEERDDEYEPDKPAKTEEDSKDMAGMEGNAGIPALAEEDKRDEPAAEEEVSTDGDPATRLHMLLKGKLSQEEMREVGEILADLSGGESEEEEPEVGAVEPAKAAEPEKTEEPVKAEDEEAVSMTKSGAGASSSVEVKTGTEEKAAGMDAAIKLAVDTALKGERANQKAIREAERAVRRYIGEVPAMSFDSAAEVYRHALVSLGVEGADKVHASALPILLKNLPVPGSEARAKPAKSLGMDAASVKGFAEMFPNAARIVRAI